MAKKKSQERSSTLHINGDVVAIKWDASVLRSLELVAEGLNENARALGKLVDVLRCSGHKVEALIRCENGNTTLFCGKVDNNQGAVNE